MNKVTLISILLLVGFVAYVGATSPGRYSQTHAIEPEVNCSVCHERPYSMNKSSVHVHFAGSPSATNATSVNPDESHRIGERVTCLTCHQSATESLANGTHITLQRVRETHPNISQTALEETHYLYQDTRSDAEVVDDTCLTCHSTHRQFQKFTTADPYLSGDSAGGGQTARIVSIGVRDWPVSDSWHVVGEENSIGVTVTNRDQTNVGVNITLDLENYAGHQSVNTYEYRVDIPPNSTRGIETPAVEGDYFTVAIEPNRSAKLNISINGTYNDVPTEIVTSAVVLPEDGRYEPYRYHTASIYRRQQLDDTLRDWGSKFRNPHPFKNITIYQQPLVVRNRTGYRHEPSAMLYYIRRNATQRGQYNQLGEKSPVYTHETGRVTTLLCATCHPHAIGDEDITKPTCGGDCHSHGWGVG